MKLDAHLEVINNLASCSGRGAFKKSALCYSQLQLAKEPSNGKYFLVISNTKKAQVDKYKLLGNVDRIYCKFVNEGKATIALKEPNFSLNIQKANVAPLKSFLKLVHMASTSANFGDEVAKLQAASTSKSNSNEGDERMDTTTASSTAVADVKAAAAAAAAEQQKPLKKPTTSIAIRSKSEYAANFRAIISQTMRIKTCIGGSVDKASQLALSLVKLVVTNCELTRIDACLVELVQLRHLDLSGNKLTELDQLSYGTLEELNVSHNEIARIGAACRLPRLINLDLSHNRLVALDADFCRQFASVSKLSVAFNQLRHIAAKFGYALHSLKSFYANANALRTLPHSLSYLRLEMLELQDNPFEAPATPSPPAAPANMRSDSSSSSSSSSISISTSSSSGASGQIASHDVQLPPPNLVEVCARFIIDKKYDPLGIPTTLHVYVQSERRCMCGRASYQNHYSLVLLYELSRISKAFTYVSLAGAPCASVPLLAHMCSWRCYRKNCTRLKPQQQR